MFVGREEGFLSDRFERLGRALLFRRVVFHFKTFVVEVSAFEFDLDRCSFSLARQVVLLKSSVYN